MQTFVVEFVVAYQMCPDCHRTEAKDHWNCLVQASLEKFESNKVELGPVNMKITKEGTCT